MVAHRHPVLLDALRRRIAEIRREAEATALGSPKRQEASAVIARIGLAIGGLLPMDTAEGQMAKAVCDLGARDVLTRVRLRSYPRYVPRVYRVSA